MFAPVALNDVVVGKNNAYFLIELDSESNPRIVVVMTDIPLYANHCNPDDANNCDYHWPMYARCLRQVHMGTKLVETCS